LAVVTVGRQSKSWSPSLSCCSGPWNVGVGQPSKLVAQQARGGSSRTTDRSQVNRSRSRNAVLVADGKGLVGDAQMVHDFARSGPSLFPSLSVLGFGIFREICGMSQFETRFSSRGEYGLQSTPKDGAGRLVACFAGLGRVTVASVRPATLSRLTGQCPLMGNARRRNRNRLGARPQGRKL
jgi:hypothetical protein